MFAASCSLILGFRWERCLPYPHCTVLAGAGEALAVRTERHAVDRAGVALEGEYLLSGARVPHLHCPVTAGAGEALAIRTEGHAGDTVRVPLEGEGFLAGGRLPHLHCLILAG